MYSEPFTMQKQSLLWNFNEEKHVWAMFQEFGGSAPNPGHYNEQLNQHGRRVACLQNFGHANHEAAKFR